MSEEKTEGLAEMEKIDFDNEYYYEINAKLIDEFMRSNYYKRCCDRDCLFKNDTTFVKQIIDAMYTDPDTYEKRLYEVMAQSYNSFEMDIIKIKSAFYYHLTLEDKFESEVYLSFDGQVGWKCLYDLYDNKTDEKNKYIFLEKYKAIRGSKYGQVLWPSHRNSINQLRATVFDDRIDYTLFDIKQFYKAIKVVEEEQDVKCDKNQYIKGFSKECRLATAYQKDDTLNWLLSFGTFEKFIDTMKLNIFVDKTDKNNYKVIDLENENKEFVENYENCAITEGYINNLINLIQGYPLKDYKSESDNN